MNPKQPYTLTSTSILHKTKTTVLYHRYKPIYLKLKILSSPNLHLKPKIFLTKNFEPQAKKTPQKHA